MPAPPDYPTRRDMQDLQDLVLSARRSGSSSEAVMTGLGIVVLAASMDRLIEAIDSLKEATDTLAFETHAAHHRAGHRPLSGHPAHDMDAEATDDED